MILKKGLLPLFVYAITISSFAQNPVLTKKDSTIVSSWMIGLGYNIVDDSGGDFDRLLDIEDSWNTLSYPSRLSIGKYFSNGLGIEASAAYNKYKKGKTIDKLEIDGDINFLSLDVRLSYDLNKIIGETGWFDPYVGIGAGYTDANNLTRGTINGTLGFRAWFSDNWGIDVNSSGKWSVDGTSTNYLQHVVGVVYRFSKKKELTKKGKEKLALINELEQEKIRVNDSIQLVKSQIEEKRKLQEQLDKEEKAIIEKEKQEAIEKEKKSIEEAIDNLDKIYFSFDSSNLNSASQETLVKLTEILRKYPSLVIKIGSHTDSRGSSNYNLKLSEKRLDSTIKYILSMDIPPSKIIGEAFGEEKLINECDDKTKCSEQKHRQNRRSEIQIISN